MCWVEPRKAVAMLVLGSTKPKMGQLLCPTTTSGISTLFGKNWGRGCAGIAGLSSSKPEMGPRMCLDGLVEPIKPKVGPGMCRDG